MKKHVWIGLGLLAAFVVFTVLVVLVDVKPIGRQGTDVGFATINESFNKFTGEHEKCYDLTEKAGYLAAIPVFAFGLIGLLQLIRRKSLLKVDSDILLLGGFYVVLGICYVLFEKLVINYRPKFGPPEEWELEPSYPSSHTLLFVAVMATAIMQIAARVKSQTMRIVLSAACIASALFVIIGRAVCGVHWFTDIFGGILLAGALSWLYYAFAFAGKEYPDTPQQRRAMEGVYAGPEDPRMVDVYAGPDDEEPEERS